jgi:hypothetical protein
MVPPGDEAKPVSCPICKETISKMMKIRYEIRYGRM